MAKRDFGNLKDRLSAVAGTQPALRPPALSVVSPAPEPETAPAPPVAKAKAAPAAKVEDTVQQAFALRPTLRKQLHRLAAEADMTVGAFILSALRAKGLDVAESDLLDRRKSRHG